VFPVTDDGCLKNVSYPWQASLEIGLAPARQNIEYLKSFF